MGSTSCLIGLKDPTVLCSQVSADSEFHVNGRLLIGCANQ